MRLENQIAIVTGASRGLGRSIATRLGTAGMRVALFARSMDELQETAGAVNAAGGDAFAYRGDLADGASVRAFAAAVSEHWGAPTVLVNNAGVGWYKPFLEHSPEEISTIMRVNLEGLIHMTHAVLPAMVERGQGQIINIASDLGRRVLPNMSAYASAKHGVLGFAGSLLREVKDKGIKVMTLTPGIIDTYFGDSQAGTREEAWSLRPDYLADLVHHLLTLPPHVVLDEVAVHPLHQDF